MPSGKDVKAFMAYYRTHFPEATVTPKLHMLEMHVIPWLQKWRVGFGLMGEQGSESIHAYFNSLGRTYQTIPDMVERIHHMMKEHYIHIASANIAALPQVKKRKKKTFQLPLSLLYFFLLVIVFRFKY